MSSDTVACFPPLAAPDARILILGSMPGIASLRAREYYAHPRNLFWRIVGELTGVPADAAYARRAAGLLDADIALWDVIASCRREGSLDAAIDEHTLQANDFAAFFRDHPGIGHVYFNGAKAEDSYRRHVLPTLTGPSPVYARLPSTSPAHAARSLDEKRAIWLAAIAPALRDAG